VESTLQPTIKPADDAEYDLWDDVENSVKITIEPHSDVKPYRFMSDETERDAAGTCPEKIWSAWTSGRVGVLACGGVWGRVGVGVGVWTCGRVGVWACGRVGVWACGRVGVWACGRVGVWACGRVGVWRRWVAVECGGCGGCGGCGVY
jgi:hypothetical protein